jgi:hypothetical protein
MKDRFDLEQEITKFSGIIEEIAMLNTQVLERDTPMTQDEIANYLMALEWICRLRFESLWDTFLQTYKLDKYNVFKDWKGQDDEQQ